MKIRRYRCMVLSRALYNIIKKIILVKYYLTLYIMYNIGPEKRGHREKRKN